LVAVTATGYDCVDLEAARRHDVAVCNVPEYSTDSVAQFVFSLLLHLVHNVSVHDRLVREGEWQRCGDFCFWRTPLVELSGCTIGIVGWGRIGQRVGTLARAFGMNVLACSRTRRNAPDYRQFEWRDAVSLFAESDVVSLHCPLTAETAGMVNGDLLAGMKPSAYLINTARGGLIVEQDLAHALAAEQLAGAALDVAPQEPIREDSPLLSAPCCVLTPHIAWATLASRQRCLQITAGNIGAFLAGQPRNLVV
jgi:glycerate dehydrogenase